ncbi:hypothetical protein SS50377_27588 [Spironucleus salmonicida]|uniref:Uncharacterized protein n=1 Tax=Spironucleus salmonicida TaxID=348837 RepID=V6LPW1_9EUKA|nr:hypothetical protein SS50377_27588 [Spironucleus salmonicida]|eukprot:EST46635.1 Hypothetical protein SS50377_13438 [Spironucleus salmonicida]
MKPTCDVPKSNLLIDIPKFLKKAQAEQIEPQMDVLIKDMNDVHISEQNLDCPMVCKIEVIAGLFEIQKKDKQEVILPE